MKPALLVLNAGSSSLKFSFFEITADGVLEHIFSGRFELVDEQQRFVVKDHQEKILIDQWLPHKKKPQLSFHSAALQTLLHYLKNNYSDYKVCAAGHRVLQGGAFSAAVVINPEIIEQLEALIPIAPLHQPHNIAGIKTLAKLMPDIFQVACFDTAFHTTQAEIAQAYALPEGISTLPLKRYGYHGLSYEYIMQTAPQYLGNTLSEGKIIIAHLGQGASLCAVRNRQSIATTMGFTALDGLPMGTRCGAIDPGIILYLLHSGMSAADITELLYKRSGLLGVSNLSNDVRLLLASDQALAKKAIDLFAYRFQRELGSLVAALDGLDGLIFTAGIGENSPEIRARLCANITWLSIKLDEEANKNNQAKISSADSKVSVWIIPTNEELVIAKYAVNLYQLRHL
jgi:acetate kinase